MAAAYAYAKGDGPGPRELETLAAIDRFGVMGVMGRPLGKGEIHRISVCQNIVDWYTERANAENWATWANANKEKAATLEVAMMLAKKMGLLKNA